jgi:uncharacterized protein YeaO (DUF488 family)
MGEAGRIRLKRVYAPASEDDGLRVLVDRLWPRGLSRATAGIDEWLKDVAPSPELRRWWDHDPDRMSEFADRYTAELDANPAVQELEALLAEAPVVTLLYAAKDESVNHARVLREYLTARS